MIQFWNDRYYNVEGRFWVEEFLSKKINLSRENYKKISLYICKIANDMHEFDTAKMKIKKLYEEGLIENDLELAGYACIHEGWNDIFSRKSDGMKQFKEAKELFNKSGSMEGLFEAESAIYLFQTVKTIEETKTLFEKYYLKYKYHRIFYSLFSSMTLAANTLGDIDLSLKIIQEEIKVCEETVIWWRSAK